MNEIWIVLEHWTIALFMVGVVVLLSYVLREVITKAFDDRVQKVYFWTIVVISLLALFYILTLVFQWPFF